MAKRRKSTKRRGFARASVSASKRTSRRRRNSGSSGTKSLMMQALGAGIYGAGREYASAFAAPVTSKMPFGELADEAVLGIASYGLATGKIPLVNKIPMSREIGRAGMLIEAARVGSYLAGNFAPRASVSNGQYL